MINETINLALFLLIMSYAGSQLYRTLQRQEDRLIRKELKKFLY